VPLQFNFNSGEGLSDENLFNLNIQPVIPIHLTPRVNMIARTIVPIESFPGPSGTRFSGFGDIQEQLFFTPAMAGKVIWGVGPVFSFPTATAEPAKTWNLGRRRSRVGSSYARSLSSWLSSFPRFPTG
jgi:hypothetical protein